VHNFTEKRVIEKMNRALWDDDPFAKPVNALPGSSQRYAQARENGSQCEGRAFDGDMPGAGRGCVSIS